MAAVDSAARAEASSTGDWVAELAAWATARRDELCRTCAPANAEARAISEMLARCATMRHSRQFDAAYQLVEHLLVQWQAPLRRARGVYYTPAPLVQYLVASMDELLRSELQVAEGLAALSGPAEDRPRLIDPSCGAGIFLARVIRHVRGSLATTWTPATAARLAASLLGFDIMSSSCHAARELLSMELQDALATVRDDACPPAAHVLNTNALTESSTAALDDWRPGGAPLLIMGNPPYCNFGRANREPWMLALMEAYRAALNEKKHNLHDDVIKFIRWSQFQIDRAGRGICALVVNHAFVTGLTHRSMRASLAQSFDKILIYDLHGSALRRGDVALPEAPGVRDENVFGVRPGIALCLMVKRAAGLRACEVQYAELRGSCDSKLSLLEQQSLSATQWTSVTRRQPGDAFAPSRAARSIEQSYRRWMPLDKIFCHYISGVQTKRDDWFTDFDRPVLAERMQRVLGNEEKSAYAERRLRPYMMAPFDVRWVYYDPQLLGRARMAVMRHMLEGGNVGLVFMRQSTSAGPYDHFLATPHLVSDRVLHSGHGAPYLAPLWLQGGLWPDHNFAEAFVRQIEEGAERPLEAHDVWEYLYGVVHLPRYRRDFGTLLAQDFPRIPVPEGRVAFEACRHFGERLLACHLAAQQVPVSADAVPFEGGGALLDSVRERWPSAWRVRIGGCAVLQRWIRQRLKRPWTLSMVAQLERIAAALEKSHALCAQASHLTWRA